MVAIGARRRDICAFRTGSDIHARLDARLFDRSVCCVYYRVGAIGLIIGLASINKNSYWWLALIAGLIMLGVGVFLATNLQLSIATFVLLVGGALLVNGIIDMLIGIFISRKAEHRILWILTGALSLIAGAVIWVYPVRGSLAFVWVLGLYALIMGVVSISKAISLRASVDEPETAPAARKR